MADEELERLYTVQEVARAYRVSEDTIRRWIKRGDLDYVPVGPFRLKRLRKSDLTKKVVHDENSNGPGSNSGSNGGGETSSAK